MVLLLPSHTCFKQKMDVFNQGSAIASKISKPTGSEAKELSILFPQSVRTGTKKPLFDPNHSLEGLPNTKKKKRGSTSLGRSVKVTVCRLSSFCGIIPKGKGRRALKDRGRVVGVC